MTSRLQDNFLVVLKLLISAGLITWLLHLVDVSAVWRLFLSAKSGLILLAVACVPLTLTLNCLRWKLSLLEDGNRLPLRVFLVSYWTSAFVGLGLPSEFGGDLLRAKDMLDKLNSRVNALASIFWSRFSGFAATIFVFGLTGLFQFQRLQELSLTWFWIAVFSLSLATLAVVASTTVRRGLGRVLRLVPDVGQVKRGASVILERIQQLATHPVYAWKIYSLAILAYLLRIITNTLYAWSLAQPVSLPDMVLVVTIVSFSSMLPISIGGIGVKEGAFVIGLTAIGVSAEAALSIALLNRSVLVLAFLLGGLMFPARHRLLKT